MHAYVAWSFGCSYLLQFLHSYWFKIDISEIFNRHIQSVLDISKSYTYIHTLCMYICTNPTASWPTIYQVIRIGNKSSRIVGYPPIQCTNLLRYGHLFFPFSHLRQAVGSIKYFSILFTPGSDRVLSQISIPKKL